MRNVFSAGEELDLQIERKTHGSAVGRQLGTGIGQPQGCVAGILPAIRGRDALDTGA
jgi:hypothetical protein